MRYFSISVLIVFLLITSAGAENTASFRKYADLYAAGDQHGEFKWLSEYVLKNPLKPESSVYAGMIASFSGIFGYGPAKDVLDRYGKLVSESSHPDKNEILYSLFLTMDNLKRNFVTAGPVAVPKRSFLNEWKISANYMKYGYADLAKEYLPEKTSAFSGRTVRSSDDGYIRIAERTYPETGVYYFRSAFRSSGHIKILVESRDFYKIYINGKPAGTNFFRNTYRNRRFFSVSGDGRYTVMLKMLTDSESEFRVSVVTDDFLPAAAENTEEEFLPQNTECSEYLIYPYEDIRRASDVQGLFALAKYFYYLGSEEFFKPYEKMTETDSSPAYLALYGSDLADFHFFSREKETAGWKILSSVWTEKKPPVPAMFYRFQQKLNEGNVNDAFEIADAIRKDADYYPLELSVLNYYLRKNYEQLFLEQYERIKKLFPASYGAEVYKMDFYQGRNNEECIQTGMKLKGLIRNERVLKNLLYYYKSSGLYEKALSCLDGRILTAFRENIERGRILILQGKYQEAKQVFLELLAENESPEILYYLGSIEVNEKRSADLYWGKLFSLEPEFEFPQDYLAYVSTGRLESEFEKYRDSDYVNSVISKFTEDRFYFPQAVAYRGEMIRVYPNLKSRYFVEELYFIRNDSEVSARGEYRVPVSSGYNIIKAEVINRDGSVTASYRKNETSSGVYVSVNGIRKNCLMHIVYEVTNYDFSWDYSSLLASNYIRLLNFKEDAGRIDVKVITELDNIILYNNWGVPAKASSEGNVNVYSFNINNVAEQENEYYSGDSRRSLPSFGFTNVATFDDLLYWYEGFFPEFEAENPAGSPAPAAEMSDSAKIAAIYDFVSRKISTEGNIYFYPSRPGETTALRRGSVEDKVFLARQLLHSCGIESYPALVRDETVMKNGICLKDSIDGILLYVPSEKMWLDFSSEYYSAGVISDYYAGNTAMVVNGRQSERIMIDRREGPSTVLDAEIDLSGDEDAAYSMRSEYSGTSGSLRHYFRDARRWGTMVSALASSVNPGMVTGVFSVSGLDDFSIPFTVESSGVILGFSLSSPDSLSFNPVLTHTGFLGYLTGSSRSSDLVIEQDEVSEEKYVYKLPQRYANNTVSVVKNFSFGNSSVSFVIRKEKGSDRLSVVKKVDFRKQVIPAAKFSEFRDFSMKVREMDSYRVMLKNSNSTD